MNFLVLALVAVVLAGCRSHHLGGNSDRESSSSRVTIDPDVYADREDGWSSHETILVTGAPRDSDVLASALRRAGDRFGRVGDTGVEYPDADRASASGDFTPSYVSDVRVTDSGLQLYVDCKGEIPDQMAEALRSILREELEATGVRAHVRALTDDE